MRRHKIRAQQTPCLLSRQVVFSLMATLLLAAPAIVESQETAEHAGFLAIKGRATFRVFCASCHGPKADGKGNVAQYLTVKPADLTQISKRHDGVFPSKLVSQVIAGNQEVRGHGSREMPIWGDVFQSVLASDASRDEAPEERAQRKIRELTAFLESIQQ
jgi:mono/diheme cytochrome c family protein